MSLLGTNVDITFGKIGIAMKRIILIIILAAAGNLYGQKIVFERTDVDSTRNGFVTATYKFGFNIYLEDLKNVNGVDFELTFDQPEVIKFSGYEYGDLGKPQVIYLNGGGIGRVIVGTGIRDTVLPDSLERPLITRLEFVVLQTATDGENVTFEFTQPVATVVESDTGRTIELESEPAELVIHSFVDVWPGDADNSGEVDHLDYAPVTQYIGLGSATKNMRSFKRKSASAIWAPHKVLTWDSAAVTYADTDGNGDISISDQLIVSYNMGKTKFSSPKSPPKLLEEINTVVEPDENLILLPVEISPEREFISAAGTIGINYPEAVAGFAPGEAFRGEIFAFHGINNGEINFVISPLKGRENSGSGANTLCYLALDPDKLHGAPEWKIADLLGINNSGNIFSLKPLTGIDEPQAEEVVIIAANGILELNENFSGDYKIYSLTGNVIRSGRIQGRNIHVEPLSPGFYFLQTGDNPQTVKFVKF
jgi:hypothetical protein